MVNGKFVNSLWRMSLLSQRGRGEDKALESRLSLCLVKGEGKKRGQIRADVFCCLRATTRICLIMSQAGKKNSNTLLTSELYYPLIVG